MISLIAQAGGLSAFEEKTPYQNNLSYDGSSASLVYFSFADKEGFTDDTLQKKLGVAYFKNFYFYKGYVVGSADTVFFVINEAKPAIIKFKSRPKFEIYLRDNNLKPLIWTRSYDFKYDLANFKDWPFIVLFSWPFILLLVILFLYSLATLKKNKHKILYTVKSAYLILCIAFVLFAYLFQIFPQSI